MSTEMKSLSPMAFTKRLENTVYWDTGQTQLGGREGNNGSYPYPKT